MDLPPSPPPAANNEEELQSPKPLAFTVDFGDGKSVDSQRHRTLVEKLQKKHRRGQSLSKIEEPATAPQRRAPHTGNLPRKSSFQSEGYFSSDENGRAKRTDLTLPLQSLILDPAPSPEIELKDVSSPDDLVSPFTLAEDCCTKSPDTASDAGTYTLDADNYSEEQKARMSIDAEFQIEQISLLKKTEEYVRSLTEPKKMLSPILSPTTTTQNLSKTFTKIMFPSPKALGNGLDHVEDQGSVISVTSSGAFRTKGDRTQARRLSLTKSEVQVEAYVDNSVVVSVPPRSPTKIPSPVHTLSRPRLSHNLDLMLSDSSLETESYLKPTQNCINSLQQRLCLDTEYGVAPLNNTTHPNLVKQRATHIRHNSLDDKTTTTNKLEHFQNKNLLHHTIDQTFTNMLNQYRMHKIQNSPNNSPIRRSSSFSTTKLGATVKNTNLLQQQQQQDPRNSPNLTTRAPSLSIQRSASTANIKPQSQARRSSLTTEPHPKIDRNQFGDTESSSEEDCCYDKMAVKKKDLSNLTNTRYNRAFSLRRARLDEPGGGGVVVAAAAPLKCPNTPEMRRKFQPEVRAERAISVDRKPVVRTNEVQSRYLLNVANRKGGGGKFESPTPPARIQQQQQQPVPKVANTTNSGSKNVCSKPQQVFARTDSGRFSMRKPPTPGTQKSAKKDGSGKKSSGRSNSSLSSREKEFQNWKRRKSYDPMKAAAEGKKKEIAKRQNMMTQSYTEANQNHHHHHQNQDCDSSPSHSSSVHRSQSFHGTAALEQLISSEEEEDLTLSADEGFSPPTPSPCELSPVRASLRNAWKDHVLH